MSSNLEYLYQHLPGFMRRDDKDSFLLRLLTPAGEEMDHFDALYDGFYQSINPQTASEEFLNWWLYSLFGWAWFPTWFDLPRKRAFYANITRYYARRGTLRGIKEFLEAFGLRVIVEAEPQFFGEIAMGEPVWSVTGPLGVVVRLFPEIAAVNEELEFYGEGTLGESIGPSPGENLQRVDVDELLRFVAPVAQLVMIEDLQL